MKTLSWWHNITVFRFVALLALGYAVLPAGQVRSGVEEEEARPAAESEAAPAGMVTLRNYASLPDLVAMIGSGAIEQMQDFFDAAPVTIEPFIVLGEFSKKQKISMLGATLSDQMAAVVGNETLAVWRPAGIGGYEQKVSGLMQEIDGYLRVHITAVNTRGERRSHVVNVEMSEPVYRALHSYVTIP